MFSDEFNECIECVLTGDDKDNVCKDCVQSYVDCNTCNKKHSEEIKNTSFESIENILKQNINKIFRSMLNDYTNNVEKCKEIMNDNFERVDLHVDFIKDEIQLRVESLKIELDKICDSMSNQLEDLRVKWKQDLQESHTKLLNEEIVENQLNYLQNLIENEQELTKKSLEDLENNLKVVNKAIKGLSNTGSLELRFEDSGLKNTVGDIVYMFPSIGETDKKIIQRIKKNSLVINSLHTNSAPSDICQHPNGNLIVVDYDDKKICVYDKKFSKIKKYLPSKYHSYICATTDDQGYIYLTDHDNHSIVKFDEDFNEIKRYSEVSWPTGLCFYNGSVYVCDSGNQRIVKLSSDLKYQGSLQLNYYARYIRNINNVACVRPRGERTIRFYNLDDFSLIREYSGHNGSITVSEYCFYEYFSLNKTFFVYNRNGELIEEIELENDSKYIEELVYTWDSLCYHNSKLLMSSIYKREIVSI